VASVFDVAAYILAEQGPVTHMKLQKLVYYCQGWHLAWDEKPLFDEPIEAWANGPVCPALYEVLQGTFTVDSEILEGALTNQHRATQLAENDLDMRIGLVALRRERGITRKEVAERTGVSVKQVKKFERLESDPRLSFVRQYANVVGVIIEHRVVRDDLEN
jgi:uncharacterized phage-associated protein